jgi:hypothetical protein
MIPIAILSIALCLLALGVCAIAWALAGVRATVRELRDQVEYLLREGGVTDE